MNTCGRKGGGMGGRNMLPFIVHSDSNILIFRRKYLTEIKTKHLICTQ